MALVQEGGARRVLLVAQHHLADRDGRDHVADGAEARVVPARVLAGVGEAVAQPIDVHPVALLGVEDARRLRELQAEAAL